MNVALNTLKGEWDYDLLTNLLKKFELDELSLTGFGSQEIALFLADDDIEDIRDVCLESATINAVLILGYHCLSTNLAQDSFDNNMPIFKIIAMPC